MSEQRSGCRYILERNGLLVQSESLFYGSIYGIYLRALHGADVGFFLRAVNQVFSGGVLAGGERHALGEIEGFSFGCRSDDNVGAVLLDRKSVV